MTDLFEREEVSEVSDFRRGAVEALVLSGNQLSS
jgi:hypothetical protein